MTHDQLVEVGHQLRGAGLHGQRFERRPMQGWCVVKVADPHLLGWLIHEIQGPLQSLHLASDGRARAGRLCQQTSWLAALLSGGMPPTSTMEARSVAAIVGEIAYRAPHLRLGIPTMNRREPCPTRSRACGRTCSPTSVATPTQAHR
jgi:hypothetical protein